MVTVVMVHNDKGEDGEEWRAGLSYSASDSFAKHLIGKGAAYAGDGTLPDVSLTAAQAAGLAAALPMRPTTLAPYALRKTQRGLARVRAGLANMTIACVSDSTGAGQYADGTNAWAGAKARSWPTALAAILTTAGYPGSIASVTSDNSTLGHGGTIPSFDSRVTSGANYIAGTLNTAGGQIIMNTAGSLGNAAAETFSFSPGTSFDTVEVYWYRSASVGTFTIDCGGSALATCSTSGGSGGTTTPGTTNQVNKTVVTKTAGADPINIIRTVLGSVIITGIVAYLSTTKCVNMLNMGWSGSRTTQWNDSSGDYSPLNALLDYSPDLTIIGLGINDSILGNSEATVTAALNALVTAALTTGDVLLLNHTWVDTTVASAANQAAVYAAVAAVSRANQVPVLDLQSRWSSYATAAALGYIHSDKTHPLQAGYQDMAHAIAGVILSL